MLPFQRGSTVTTQVRTVHRKDENGEQTTTREVVTTDATGSEHVYPFVPTEDGHEYVGEGEPSDLAVEAIEAWEDVEAAEGDDG